MDVDAQLLVRDGATSRDLNIADWKTPATGASTEDTLATVLVRLSSILAELQSALEVTVMNPTANPETGLAKVVDIQAVRDRLPAAFDADDGLKSHVQNFPATQSVSAVSLPLPAGAALDASLVALSGKIGMPASDDVLVLLRAIAASTATEVTRTDTLNLTADQVQLNTDQVEAKLDTANARIGQAGTSGTLADLLDQVRVKLNASLAVTGTFWQATQPVNGTVAVSNPTANPETGLAKAVDVQAVRDRLPATLDGGALNVADVFTGGEVLADQAGDGTVKTFAFSSPVDLVWIRSAAVARADPFGGTPTASLGIPCAADEPNPITVRTSLVKVFAASGTISLWGYRS